MQTPNVPTEIALLLGRLDGKLDTIITKTDALEQRVHHLEQRISHIEGAGKGMGTMGKIIAGLFGAACAVAGVIVKAMWG